ncbi:hypothetical protein DPMN_174477 [Dreissena polymorpha]|uniref:Uncharacterized protein n=1 Tax=Dreissena polymorpha TaxID=45954 RepID=A0A9D4E4S4_DREPO|nr:hypothetical protein DPMN_174477 [Dreissena polymorpha]
MTSIPLATKDLLQSSAKTVLGRERRNNKLWVTTKIKDRCDKKRRALKHEKPGL